MLLLNTNFFFFSQTAVLPLGGEGDYLMGDCSLTAALTIVF